jgi:dUTP pyrophosphatase
MDTNGDTRMKLKYKLLHHNAKPPAFATDGAACFDLYAASMASGSRSRVYGTGLAFDIPDGYHVELYIRSGLAFKGDFILANAVPIIDNDFIGEVMCKLTYLGNGQPDWPWIGDRIAQGRLVRTTKTELEETETLKETKRGDAGFGSTGK